MGSPSVLYPKKVDLTNCDKEPIHILGKVQNHGALLVCDENTHVIERCSANISLVFAKEPSDILKTNINNLLDESTLSLLQKNLDANKVKPIEIKVNGGNWILIAHKNNGEILLEIEPEGQKIDSLEYQ
ncbi:MAG: histidine kinase, partial [Leeuwenhoekiella sp.]